MKVLNRTMFLLICVALTAAFVIAPLAEARTITYLGKSSGVTNYLGMGDYGYYFPAFNAGNNRRKPDSNDKFSMPSWLGWDFNINSSTRTFSPDAGVVSWSPFIVGVYATQENGSDYVTTPGNHYGRAGQAVDEAAAGNTNNSINRIQLGAGTPASFIMRIVLDTANGQHEPRGSVTARGSNSSGSIDVSTAIPTADLTFNNVPDVYSFRYDGWVNGDYIKLRLNSGTSAESGSFSALMFDAVAAGFGAVPEPSSIVMILSCLLGLGRRHRRVD